MSVVMTRLTALNRYIKRSLVESPWITVTAVLCTIGTALPTYRYYTGGREKEQREKFDLRRSATTHEHHDEQRDMAGERQWNESTPARSVIRS